MGDFKINCLRHFQLGICLEDEFTSITGSTGFTGFTGPTGFSTNTGPTGPIGHTGVATLGAYGQFYGINFNLTMTGMNTYCPFIGMTGLYNNNITYSNNPSTLTLDQTGVYLVNYSINGTSNLNNIQVSSGIFVNGQIFDPGSTSITYQQSGDDQTQSVTIIMSLVSGDDITLRQSFTNGGHSHVDFDTHSLQLTMIKIA